VTSGIKDLGDSIKVLYIDDDPSMLIITKSYLEKFDAGIEVRGTSNPDDLIKQMDAFDCIVSDYKMPVIDGIELAKKIRIHSSIPFILYTGQGSEEVASEAYDVGIDDYFRKEIEKSHYQVFARRIRGIVEKHRYEDRLKESEVRFRSLFELSPMAIAIQDIDGYPINVNEAFTQLTGFTRSEMMGRTLPALARELGVPSEQIKLVINTGLALHDGIEVDPFEYAFTNKKGIKQKVRVYTSLLKNEEKILGIQVIALKLGENLDYS